MSIWERYSKEQREKYIMFLRVYGALSNLFRQKHGDLIPYLDSKFQETIFAKAFDSLNVDIGNTPHDILSVFGSERIGIGLKTWMNSRPSYQKVMQIKSYQSDIQAKTKEGKESLVHFVSSIKNERMRSDYFRLGLKENANIYHYVMRDKGRFIICETEYPLVDIDNIRDVEINKTSVSWSDGLKNYRFTFADSQIWQKFDSSSRDTINLEAFDVEIMNDPFEFLLNAYLNYTDLHDEEYIPEIVEVYLPLYSYSTKKVPSKSALNAWNAAPKNKESNVPRPLNEVYIPIPIEFHRKFPDFFVDNIFDVIRAKKSFKGAKSERPEVRFHLRLPDGRTIPALVTQDNMKGLQSGSTTEIDPITKKCYGQSALGQWLLVDVLGLKDRVLVTRDWLQKKGTDSVRLWRYKDNRDLIYIDFAPYGSFENFMEDSF